MTVRGLTRVPVASAKDVTDLLAKAQERKQALTHATTSTTTTTTTTTTAVDPNPIPTLSLHS